MVFVKRICPPERRKAIIAVEARTSHPTLLTNDEAKAEFQLRISLQIAESTRPGKAITIRVNDSVFAVSDLAGDLDVLGRGTVGLTAASDQNRRINLGQFLIHRARPETQPPPDLRERPGVQLLTIPAEGKVEVVHNLPLNRVFKYEEQLRPADVEGETWRLKLNDGAIGTTWWCWGDLAKDLEDKKLSAWHEGMRPEVMPKPDVGEEWVLGCNPVELVFEDRSIDSTFQFVK